MEEVSGRQLWHLGFWLWMLCSELFLGTAVFDWNWIHTLPLFSITALRPATQPFCTSGASLQHAGNNNRCRNWGLKMCLHISAAEMEALWGYKTTFHTVRSLFVSLQRLSRQTLRAWISTGLHILFLPSFSTLYLKDVPWIWMSWLLVLVH